MKTLATVLAEPLPCFYVLANTRALPTAEAVARAEEIGANLRAAAATAGIDPARLGVVSRGDSTLCGSWLERDVLSCLTRAPHLLPAPSVGSGRSYAPWSAT